MKLKTFFCLSFFLLLHPSWGKEKSQWLSQSSKWEKKIRTFIKKPTLEKFNKLKRNLRKEIKSQGEGFLLEIHQTQRESLLFDTIVVYLAELLPQDLSGRSLYFSCYPELFYLSKKPTESKFYQAYLNCLVRQFAENLPQNYIDLLGALEKLSSHQ